MIIKFTAVFMLLSATVPGHTYEQHSLEWPSQISASQYKVGPILHQFQQFSSTYFHNGVDILVPSTQSVFSPITGVVDGGYYSYDELPSGLSKKNYISIRDIDPEDKEHKLWGENYFELSITDSKGLRFELHHINRASLSTDLIASIQNQETVVAGYNLGTVVQWPEEVRGTDYSHIHYNIINDEGAFLNPLWYSKPIEDSVPPKISSVHAAVSQKCSANGLRQLKELSQLKPSDQVTHLVIQTTDSLGENSFPHPPTKLSVDFENEDSFSFDYSYALFTNELNSYLLRDLFVGRFCIGAADFPFILPGSTNFNFYIQVPVPPGFTGRADISVSDFTNNTTKKTVNF